MSYCLSYLRGLPYNPDIPEDRLDELAKFPLRQDDLFIVTYPKSGTTWTQQIVKMIKMKAIDDDIPISHSIPWLEQPAVSIENLSSPRTFKCHATYELMPGGEPEMSIAKYIYVARNPKDTAVSLYHHALSMKLYQFTGDWNIFFELFVAGKVNGGVWFKHVLEWWKHKDASNILFLKYEDMKRDLKAAVKKIAEFIDIRLEPDITDKIVSQCTFDSMKDNPAVNYSWYSDIRKEGSEPWIRKGMIGDWKNYFSEEQSLRYDEEYRRMMSGTGLDFQFHDQ